MHVCVCVGMESSAAYQGCPVCLHTWTAGATLGQRKCINDGYRRFLSLDSRGRRRTFRHGGHVYEFYAVETRPLPKYRDNQFVEDACRFASQINAPFLGHKFPPHPAMWPKFDFRRFNPGELMHDTKVMTEMIIKCLVGKGPAGSSYEKWSKDAKHRAHAKTLNIMPDIWPENGGALPWRLTGEASKQVLRFSRFTHHHVSLFI